VFLVHAEEGVEILLTEEGQMGKGAERAIPSKHVSRPQRRMQCGDARHVVSVPGIRDNVHEEPGPRVKQGEEMRHRDPTARALPPWLAKVLLEFWGIRHRETRPVHQEGAVTPPPPLVLGRLVSGGSGSSQSLLEHDER
jgi:hypothetical protein